jgi:hypothetical protein
MKKNRIAFVLATKDTEKCKEFSNEDTVVKIPQTLKFFIRQRKINCDNIFIYF